MSLQPAGVSQGHPPAPGFLATAAGRVPGILPRLGFFLSYTRPAPSCFVLHAWILLDSRFSHHQLRGLSANCMRHSQPSIPNSRTPAGFSARRGCSRCARSPRAAGTRDRDLVFYFSIGVMRERSAASCCFTSQTKVLSVLISDLNESGAISPRISVLGTQCGYHLRGVVLAVNQSPVVGANCRRQAAERLAGLSHKLSAGSSLANEGPPITPGHQEVKRLRSSAETRVRAYLSLRSQGDSTRAFVRNAVITRTFWLICLIETDMAYSAAVSAGPNVVTLKVTKPTDTQNSLASRHQPARPALLPHPRHHHVDDYELAE